MKFYGQNPYCALTNDLQDHSSNQTLQERLANKYKPKKFSVRWKKLRFASLLSSYFCNGLSLLSGAFAIGMFIWLQMQHLTAWAATFLSAIVGISIALLLEIFKRSTSSNFLQTGFQFRDWRPVSGGAMLLLTSISIGLSFYGSSKLPQATIPPPSPIHSDLENLAALRTDFGKQLEQKNSQITAKKVQIEEFLHNHKSSRSNKLSSAPIARQGYKNLNEELALLEKELSLLQTQRNNELSAATQCNRKTTQNDKAENALLLTTYSAGLKEQGYTLAYFSIFFELVFLLCVLFCEFYDFRSYLEECAIGLQTSTPPSNNKNPSTSTRVQLIQHTNREGEVREYKKSQVQYFIDKYQQRIKSYLEQGKQALADRNEKVLGYWQGRLQEFTD